MRMDSKFDSALARRALNCPFAIANDRFLKLGLALLLISMLRVGLHLEGSCLARQSATTSESRQTPAPWRPAFGPLNKAAVPGEDVSGAGSTPRTQPGFNLAPNHLNTLRSAETNNNLRGPSSSNGSAPPVAQQPVDRPQPEPITQPGFTRVSKTLEKLPNTAGQVWREYDISPYTSRVKTTADPQKSITEWVLRETGTEMWFHQPLGILNAEKDRLLVYHTPEIHGIVKGIVDRFNRTRGQVQNIDFNLVTIENPNWRSQSYTMLQPIEVKSPGIEAWMISKENAAILLGQLRRRGDFKQHNGGRIANHDGQSFVLEKTQPVQFVRNLRWVPNQVPNYQPQMTTVDEGYRLELSCLSALDNQTIEAVIKCDVDQVEKLNKVKVSVPAPGGGAQQMNLQIPQIVSWRLHERFRWPNDQVLLLSCGVVATPEPQSGGGFKIPGLTKKSKRADALLFVEYRGPANGPMVPQTADRLAPIRQR